MTLRGALPRADLNLSVKDILISHESTNSTMANHLHGLTSHYDEMDAALKDSESGIVIGEEDLAGMHQNLFV
jgi:autophagy-related protein 17